MPNPATIGAAGDYPDLDSWQSAEVNDLQAAGEIQVAQMLAGTVSQGTFTLAGWNSSASFYPQIINAPGAEHNGVLKSQGGAGALFSCTDSTAVVIAESYAYLEGFEITSTQSEFGHLFAQDAGLFMSSIKMIFYAPLLNNGAWVWKRINGAPSANFENCLFISAYRNIDGGNAPNSTYYNMTMHQTQHGLWEPQGLVTNVVSFGSINGADFGDDGGGTYTNCSSGDTTAQGTGFFHGIVDTPGQDFVDPSAQNYNVVPGGNVDGAVNAGTDLSGIFTDDIANNTRVVPWERGAFEIAAAAGTDVTLNWTDNSNDETEMRIYRVQSVSNPDPAWGPIYKTLGADVITDTDLNVADGTWWYRVTAFNAFGESTDEGTNIEGIVLPGGTPAIAANVLISDQFNRADGAINGSIPSPVQPGANVWDSTADYQIGTNQLVRASGNSVNGPIISNGSASGEGIAKVFLSEDPVSGQSFAFMRSQLPRLSDERNRAEVLNGNRIRLYEQNQLRGETTYTVRTDGILRLACNGPSMFAAYGDGSIQYALASDELTSDLCGAGTSNLAVELDNFEVSEL